MVAQVCTLLQSKTINHHFSKILAENSFLADYFILAKHCRRTQLFNTFGGMSEAEENLFDQGCQQALQTLLPAMVKMIKSSEEYAIQLEGAMLKRMEREVADRDAEKETGTKKTTKRKLSVKQPESFFETDRLSFIQGEGLQRFMASLPFGIMRLDRTFGVILFSCLCQLFESWIKESLGAAQVLLAADGEVAPTEKSTAATTVRIIVTVDEDSEVHRFVGSGACAYSKHASKRLKRLEQIKQQREKEYKPLKSSHERELKTVKSSLLLLRHFGVLRKFIPPIHDKSYDSPVMVARDKGGLLYVAPKFLILGMALMKRIRASISKKVISSLGRESQKLAYKHVLSDESLESLFKSKVKELETELSKEFDDRAVKWVWQKVVDFAFHARSAVEWNKYRAEKTDRTAGKEKKMGVRELLKGST